MTTATEPLTDADRRYYAAANRLCLRHCRYWVDGEGHCQADQRQCPTFPRLAMLWATDAQKPALQVSDIPDPLVTHPGHVYLGDGLWRRATPATGPSIRAALNRPSRGERALGWVVATLVREPMALVCYAVSLLAVGYVGWAMLAAVTEGRLRLGW